MTAPSAARIADRLPDLVFGPVTRAMLAIFAGASGDHNPIHIDTDFARASGADDVFAQGMLPMGVLTRLVTTWAGHGALRRIQARFVARTPVGAVLTCAGAVTGREETPEVVRLELALSVHLDDGTVVLRGSAQVELVP